jgi:hypothetical protein
MTVLAVWLYTDNGCSDYRMAILTSMVVLTMDMCTVAILTELYWLSPTMVLLTMALLTMVVLAVALLCTVTFWLY